MAKQVKETVKKLKGLLHRPDQPPVPVVNMSIFAPGNTRKRYTSAEFIAQCESNEEIKAWDRMVSVGKEITK
jgi:hypothetical protein